MNPFSKIKRRTGRPKTSAAKSTDTLTSQAWITPRLEPAAQKEFLETCWDWQINTTDLISELQPYQSYFDHYQQSCLYVQLSLQRFSHDDFCKVTRCLISDTRLNCESNIRTILNLTAQEHDLASTCIEFVGNAILLINLSKWAPSETLSTFISRVAASPSTQKDRFRLTRPFNARMFERVAGIEINWTRDLLSHLRVGPEMSSLTIFHHAQILHLYETSQFQSVFPPNFVAETRSTLSLVIPADRQSRAWFAKKQQKLDLDPSAGHCPYLAEDERSIRHFDFWRDRLIIAKEMYDSSQPGGIVQFWRDDRNKVQWWTFWIAFVVFLLTMAGVVEGALQVYKAYYPTNNAGS